MAVYREPGVPWNAKSGSSSGGPYSAKLPPVGEADCFFPSHVWRRISPQHRSTGHYQDEHILIPITVCV